MWKFIWSENIFCETQIFLLLNICYENATTIVVVQHERNNLKKNNNCCFEINFAIDK